MSGGCGGNSITVVLHEVFVKELVSHAGILSGAMFAAGASVRNFSCW